MATKKTTKKLKNPKGKKVTREVELGLDDETRAKLGKELGEKLKAETNLKTEFAEVKQKWGERIKPIAERVKAIENFFENGTEKKVVECVMVKNHDNGRVEYWYDGRVVDHRPITADDHQEEMKLQTRKGRIKKNSVVFPPKDEDEEIANVRKLETSRRTKRSAVDGAINKDTNAEV